MLSEYDIEELSTRNQQEQHQDMEDKRHALHDAWKRIKSGAYSMTDVDIVDGAIRELL